MRTYLPATLTKILFICLLAKVVMGLSGGDGNSSACTCSVPGPDGSWQTDQLSNAGLDKATLDSVINRFYLMQISKGS